MIKMYKAPELSSKINHVEIQGLLQAGGPGARTILKLESTFNKVFNAKTLFFNSGTSAFNQLILQKKIKGKKITVSPITFPSIISSIVLAGGIPEFTGLDTNGLSEVNQLNDSELCVPIHLYGFYIDTKNWKNILVHDTCQSYGVKINSVHLADYLNQDCTLSFSWGKWLSSGEGGLLITKNEDTFISSHVARMSGLIINDYSKGETEIINPSLKYSQSSLNAYIVLDQLKTVDDLIWKSKVVKEKLKIKIQKHVPHIIWNENGNHLYFGVRAESKLHRDEIVKKLKASSIEFFYGHKPAFLYKAFKDYKCLDYQSVDKYWDTVLLIPSHYGLTDVEIERIAECFC